MALTNKQIDQTVAEYIAAVDGHTIQTQIAPSDHGPLEQEWYKKKNNVSDSDYPHAANWKKLLGVDANKITQMEEGDVPEISGIKTNYDYVAGTVSYAPSTWSTKIALPSEGVISHTHDFQYNGHQVLGKRRTSVIQKCKVCNEISTVVLEGIWTKEQLV